MIKTILGNIAEEALGVVLPHEHICCYFEYFDKMCGDAYLDKAALEEKATADLIDLRERYGLGTIVDCTPINIGRDLALIRRVSERSGVHFVASTGFYYTEEAMLGDVAEEEIARYVLWDVENHNIGHLKFAVDQEEMSELQKKMLRAMCLVQKKSGLPLCVHTNGRIRNGKKILDYVLEQGVEPAALTIGHLSDCGDTEFIKSIAASGCYLGFDRIYKGDRSHAAKCLKQIRELWDDGYGAQILLSHDALAFNGFHTGAQIRQDNPYDFILQVVMPMMNEYGLTEDAVEQITRVNPARMLCCGKEGR